MTVGTGYLITVTNGFGYATDQCAIWVDWNKNQDFTDPGEQITVTGTPGVGPYLATITPPTGTAAGTTRMRVRISGQGSFNSCGTTMYGETEDYTINIGGTPPTKDVGVIELLTPVTGTTLGANETVKVRICNFGTVAQSNIPVGYIVNGGATVTETVTATVAPGATYDYTFTQKANMGTLGGMYTFLSYTSLTGDQNSANDGVTRTIFHAWAQYQKVVQGEYFINTDPGVGNGIAISGTYNLVDVTINLTNLNLPAGSRVYVRLKSQNGKWSFPRSFKRQNYMPNMNATLNFCEYFINTDPGQGNGTSTTITGGITNINNLNVPVGSHLYVRVKDSFGRWSKPMGIKRNAWFPNQNATLTFAEYFLNSDPGQGNGTSVSVTSGIINLTNLNVPVGSKIYARVKDSFNRWSQPWGIKRLGYYTMTGAELQNGEYFLDTDPGQGNGSPLTFTGGIADLANFDLPLGSVAYVRVKDTYNRWSYPRGYKRPGIINSKGSDLAAVEYFINADPGQGNGIQLPFSSGTVHIDSLTLHHHDVVYVRSKDSFNRWGPPSIWKYHFKDFQKAEYKIKLAAGGTTTLPLPLRLIPPPDSTCGWVGKKDTLTWHKNDTIWARFQDQDGFYTNWKRGVIAYARADTTICAGASVILTATGGGSYLWSNGQSGPSIQVFPAVTTKYWVTVSDGAGASSVDTVIVSVNQLPVAGSIFGMKDVCAGATVTTYTTPIMNGASSYIWSLPPGATGSSTTNSITVTYPGNASSGLIKVKGVNTCGQGQQASLLVHVYNCAAGPSGIIAGPSVVSPGSENKVYSVVQISNATTYIWSIPVGSSIVAGFNTNSVTINYSDTAVSGIIQVYGANACGNGLPSPAFYVTVNTLVPPVRDVKNVNVLNSQSECYDATQTVTIAGNNSIFTVENGGQANVIAGETIILKPMTKVYPGGYFHAWITSIGEFCSTDKSFLATGNVINKDSFSEENGSQNNRTMVVYPNPTTGSFTLEFQDGDIPVQTKVKILDMRGNIVVEKESILTNRMVFSLDGRQAGIYFLHTLRGNRVENTKIIKK